MKLIINCGYNDLEFTKEEIEELKLWITNQLKDNDRQLGTAFLIKGITFVIQAIYFDIRACEKIIVINQATTHSKIIEQPKQTQILKLN